MTLKPLTRALGPLGVTSGTKHLWTPADMPTNLVLWLAADKIVGLTDGQSVASWADASGTGSSKKVQLELTATQTTSMQPGGQHYQLIALLSNGDSVTLARGALTMVVRGGL